MSSFYDLASLVVVPSGYQSGKIYAQKPLSTDGELTFSRATSATRVGPDGLIEKVRTNVLTYSQDLSNAAWKTATDGGTITKTANAGTAPDGTNTASRVQVAGGGTYSLVYQDSVNPLGIVVISGYFKRYGGTNQTFRLFGDNGSALSGTLTATDTWQRFSFVMNASSTGADGLAADASNNAYDILVWGMQLETGDIATDYIATTSAAVSVGPVANLPRLDYLDSTCPRLLLEPQRTNTLTYSEAFDNAAWTKGNATISANTSATLDPSGYNGADKLQEDSSTDSHFFGSDTASASSAEVVTYSIFLKAAERSFAALRLYTGSGSIFGYYNLANGTLGTIGAGGTGTIVSYGNGWYRCSLTITMASSSVTLPYVFTSTGDGVNSYTGTTGSGIYCFGAQQEIGAYETSYIGPTLGSASTRGSWMRASKTGISSLIGQTEGTIYGEFANPAKAANGRYFSLSDGTAGDRIDVYAVSPTSIGIYASKSYSAIINTSFAVTANAPFKYAIAYKAGQWAWYLNGVQIGTSADSNVPIMSAALLTTDPGLGPAAEANPAVQALLFKTRLTNAQLAELTTL
jgi:hypothetical protein